MDNIEEKVKLLEREIDRLEEKNLHLKNAIRKQFEHIIKLELLMELKNAPEVKF